MKKLITGIVGVLFWSGLSFAADKPNVLFIMIDDLGWKDVGFMGSTYYETPNVDKIAQTGMVFMNAYTLT